MYLIIKLILLIYTATCTSHIFSQITNSTRKVKWTNTDSAINILFNLVPVVLFAIIYFKHYILINEWFLLVIILHHIIRAMLNLRKFHDIREWSMEEIYFNMLTYAGTVGGVLLLWFL